jgi:heterodisulfide reductase subunit C
MSNEYPYHDIDLAGLNHRLYQGSDIDPHACSACCLCASSCPVAGIDGFDPRKLVRLAALNLTDEPVASRWPWICTMCGKCAVACPMQVDIPALVRDFRSQCNREKVPGILHKGLDAALRTGNNLGLPDEDYVFILEDVAEELAAEPGFQNFKVPIDKQRANLLLTVHNKLVNTHTEDLKHLWKILYAAGEDWTVPADNWEGTSWGYFTGDDQAVETMSGRIVAHMERLQIKNLLWPE